MKGTAENTTDSTNVPLPEWGYNPSSWRQRIPVALWSVVAFAIAGYMAFFQWGLIESVWDPVFGTSDKVLKSDVSHRMHRWFVIPDAALGAFAYLGDAVLAMAGSTRRWQCRPWLVLLFGIDVIPLGIVSVILVILQGTVVQDWCFPCLITAVISLILIWYAYDEVWSSLMYLRTVWRRTRDRRILWNTFWGRPSPEAAEAGEAYLRRKCGQE